MPDLQLNAQSIVTTSATTAPAAGTSEAWTVTALGAGIRTLVAGDTYALVDATSGATSGQQAEIVRVTAATTGGTSITVTRGADGTTPVAHANPSTFNIVVAAGAMPKISYPDYAVPTTSAFPLKNTYDVLRGIYNYKSSNTRILEQGLSRAMAGGLSSHLVLGDSVSAGAIAQSGAAWLFDRIRAWPLAMRDQLAMLGVPTAGTGIIRHVDGPTVTTFDPRWTYPTGPWVNDGSFTHTVTVAASAVLTPDRDGTIWDQLYFDSGLGTFTMSVDGVVLKTVVTNGAAGWKVARITGLTIKAGITQLKVICTVTGGGGVYLAGGSVWSPNGGLLVHNASQSGATASGTGAAAWADISTGASLGGVYLDVAGRKRTVTDGASTSGSSTLTSATGAFTADDVGKTILQVPGASGPMFSGECYIGAFLSSTTVTVHSGLTGAPILASNTTSSQTVVIGRDPDCVHIPLGLNDLAASVAPSTITAAITTIRNRYPSSDCILHLVNEMSTALVSAANMLAFQKAMYALADTLDLPLYDWRDRVGTFAQGQANGSYGDDQAHLTPATETDLGSQLGWVFGGGGARPQSAGVPVNDADLSNKKYVDNRTATNASVADQTGFASDTYLAGSNVVVPPGAVKAKTVYRCRFYVSKTAAGVAAPVFIVRTGTTGTTSDTARVTMTHGIQSAAVDAGFVDIDVVFRTVGSGTSAVVTAGSSIHHQASTTGLTNLKLSTQTVTSSGFDSTTLTNIGVSVNGGASAAWTITLVEAGIRNVP